MVRVIVTPEDVSNKWLGFLGVLGPVDDFCAGLFFSFEMSGVVGLKLVVCGTLVKT